MTKRYFFSILSGTILLIAVMAGFNLLVDPYWYYRIVEIDGFNKVKPEFFYFEDDFKPLIALKKNPTTIILGDSYSEIGLDPTNEYLNKAGEKTYNLGIRGSGWVTSLCLFEWLTDATNVKTVILGINITWFSKVECREEIKKISKMDHVKALLSMSALQSSFKTLIYQDAAEATHTSDGLYFYTRRKSNPWERFAQELKQFDACLDPKYKWSPSIYGYNFAGIKQLLTLAQKKGIRVVLLIHPRHALLEEGQILCHQDFRLKWDPLTKLIRNLEAFSKTTGHSYELWVFSGYNKFTTELPSGEGSMTYWQDPAHYNPELGNLFLNDIFGPPQPKLGHRLTAQNLEAYLQELEEQRQEFLQSHPEFLERLKQLVGGK